MIESRARRVKKQRGGRRSAAQVAQAIQSRRFDVNRPTKRLRKKQSWSPATQENPSQAAGAAAAAAAAAKTNETGGAQVLEQGEAEGAPAVSVEEHLELLVRCQDLTGQIQKMQEQIQKMQRQDEQRLVQELIEANSKSLPPRTNRERKELIQDGRNRLPKETRYSQTYNDKKHQYRHVTLTAAQINTLIKMDGFGRDLEEGQWRSLHLEKMGNGWQHIGAFGEPWILLFRRPLIAVPLFAGGVA